MASLPSDRHLPFPEPWERQTVAVYRPRHYEPGYAYPLLVLLHGRGGDEHQLLRLISYISARNYVAVAVRGPEPFRRRRDGSIGYGWGLTWPGAGEGEGAGTFYQPAVLSPRQLRVQRLADRIQEAAALARTRFNIHPQRVFLVGYGEGAAAAYRVALGPAAPCFAGLVAFNGWLPRGPGPLLWLPAARGLRVLIAHGLKNRLVPVTRALYAHRLLYTAGLPVSLRVLQGGHRISSVALRLINQWVMDCLPSSTSRLPVA